MRVWQLAIWNSRLRSNIGLLAWMMPWCPRPTSRATSEVWAIRVFRSHRNMARLPFSTAFLMMFRPRMVLPAPVGAMMTCFLWPARAPSRSAS